jgi:predicted transport protein
VTDLKMFHIIDGKAHELAGAGVALEKSLQTLIEANMETLFGVRFLAGEYSTGLKHGGRIDSLGIDENGSPVIFEYKRSVNESVINQGLFYLDWLLDHRAEFELMVMKRYGADTSDRLDWTSPRLICVAQDFTRYDQHAIGLIGRNIELVRYRDYGGEYLTLDLVASTGAAVTAAGGSAPTVSGISPATSKSTKAPTTKTVSQLHEQASEDLKALYAELDAMLLALGDDVTKTVRQNYYAFRRLKNFACVEVHPQTGALLVYLKVDAAAIDMQAGFSRDVSKIGHFGTGDLELTIRSPEDLVRAEPLIRTSYQSS